MYYSVYRKINKKKEKDRKIKKKTEIEKKK
jgi:hypothetical protein